MAQVSIGSLSDFEEGTPTFAEVDGTRLCVVRVGDAVHAVCDDCPHAEASLSEGDFLADDMAIECPLHGSAFNLVTGDPDTPPATEAVRVYPVTVDGDDVLVELSAAAMPITLIVGGGMAGRAAALTLRRVGYQGEIVLVGDEPTPPYDRPPLSKSVIVGTADLAKVVKPTAEAYAEDGVDLRLGVSVVAADAAARTASLSDGTVIAWDALVLAMGCAPREVPIPGLDLPGVFRVTRLDEALAVQAVLATGPKRLAVIGGGFIGMEAAAAAVAAGHTATVLEAAPEPMARPLGLVVAERVLRWATDRGVEVRAGIGVEEVLGDDRASGVRLADGDIIDADLVICAIGQVPRLALAEQLGCALAAGGVQVDAGMRTSLDGVYAVGDIAAFPSKWADEDRIRVEHAGVAIGHGQTAAEQIATGEGLFEDLPTFWSDQGDLTLNVVGVPRPDDEIVWRGDQAIPACTAFYLRDGRLRAAMSAGDMKTLRAVRKLFAADISPTPDQLADADVDLAALAAG